MDHTYSPSRAVFSDSHFSSCILSGGCFSFRFFFRSFRPSFFQPLFSGLLHVDDLAVVFDFCTSSSFTHALIIPQQIFFHNNTPAEKPNACTEKPAIRCIIQEFRDHCAADRPRTAIPVAAGCILTKPFAAAGAAPATKSPSALLHLPSPPASRAAGL